MDTGTWDEIRGKLDFARAGKPMLIGMATILVLVAVASALVLSGAATSSNFTVHKSGESGQVQEAGVDEQLNVFVHVSGEVANPGLYELPKGARVADAVSAAGGFLESADMSSCNLARLVQDGEQIIVLAASTDAQQAGGQGAPAAGSSLKVNLNTATADQLQELPGIGKATAQKIVADRLANGPFKTVDDLTRVSGIGQKKLAAFADLVYV